jgi:hypothetical protein
MGRNLRVLPRVMRLDVLRPTAWGGSSRDGVGGQPGQLGTGYGARLLVRWAADAQARARLYHCDSLRV